MRKIPALITVAALAACGDDLTSPELSGGHRPKFNVIFFLGDGMGTTTVTASRIFAVGEAGSLTMDTLPEVAWVRTYSLDAMVTDSAPSMSAYMTGVKQNNETVSMTPETLAIPPGAGNTIDNCASLGPNGSPVPTLLEQAIAAHRATGIVTTTRVTHATPATTYAHICHRDLEDAIAAQMVPDGPGYNDRLRSGLDVVLGGGRRHYLPTTAGGGRVDGRDLIAELTEQGYSYVRDAPAFAALDLGHTKKLLGLFAASHMTYELDRDPIREPSLAQMTLAAMEILEQDPDGYFLMVEGGRIDHALHETNAKRALVETVAFDAAIAAALAKARETDPDLGHTLIVVTADHDHTLALNGYAKRTGPTTPTEPGVLGLVKDYRTGAPVLDAEGMPYSILGFGTGDNRVAGPRSAMPALTDDVVSADGYHQEAAVRVTTGNETHGGTDVSLMAIGEGADAFHGFMTNTAVYGLVRTASGL